MSQGVDELSRLVLTEIQTQQTEELDSIQIAEIITSVTEQIQAELTRIEQFAPSLGVQVMSLERRVATSVKKRLEEFPKRLAYERYKEMMQRSGQTEKEDLIIELDRFIAKQAQGRNFSVYGNFLLLEQRKIEKECIVRNTRNNEKYRVRFITRYCWLNLQPLSGDQKPFAESYVHMYELVESAPK